MVEFGTSSAFRGWARVRVLGYGFGMRGRKVKSRDCALASDLVKADAFTQTSCLHVTVTVTNVTRTRAARLLDCFATSVTCKCNLCSGTGAWRQRAAHAKSSGEAITVAVGYQLVSLKRGG